MASTPSLDDKDSLPSTSKISLTPHSSSNVNHQETESETNSSDEFNWDEDEDSIKQKNEGKTKAHKGRALWLLFMRLARPVRTLLVGILGAGFFIAPLLVVQFRFRNSTVHPQVQVWSLWFSIVWAACCITYLVVDAVPGIVISIVVLFGGKAERLVTQLELTLAVSGWLKLALDISWAWITLSVLRGFYNPPGSYWVIINRVMQALFAAGIILLAEKLFLQYVAINFHRRALADRLSENRLGLKALERLSNAQPAPPKKTWNGKKGHRRSGTYDALSQDARTGTLGSPVTDAENFEGSNSGRSGHSHVRRRRQHKAMASVIVDQLGGAIGQVASKLSKDSGGAVGSLHSARKLAKKLFDALSDVHPPRSYLIVEDFEPYFRSAAEAHAAFALFDKDSNGDISKREMREAVQRIYRERKALIASLKDISSAVAKLDAVLLSCATIGLIFVCLLIFNRKNTLASLVPLATVVLGFSFIFGHSAQLLFESLIFVLSTHVFDVGDLVLIDEQALVVREFGLFSTTFRRVDGQEIIAPNALLANSKLIHNIRRSNSMWESTQLVISYNTPLEVIDQLRTRIDMYVQQNTREWSGSGLNIDKMEYQNDIYLTVAMEHRPNWQDWGGRWARRTAFMKNLKTILEDLDVRYTKPVQPILLPRTSGITSPHLQPPSEMFGNAGTLGVSHSMRRAPTRSIRRGGDTF